MDVPPELQDHGARQDRRPSARGNRSRQPDGENEREIATLKKAFGHFRADQLEKGDAYEYLDACLLAVNKDGIPRLRPEKGNKEIALMRTILEWGVRVRAIKINPFEGVEKLPTVKRERLVSQQSS